MDKDFMQGIGAFAAAIIGLATLAVILSKNSQTTSLVQTAGSSFAGVLAAATAPVTGTGGVGSNGGFTSSVNSLTGGANALSSLLQAGNSFGGLGGSSSDPWSGAGAPADNGGLSDAWA